MGFDQRQPISYAKMKDGRVEVYRGKDKNGEKIIEKFDQMSGVVKDITLKEGEYQGEKIQNWNIKIDDGNEVMILSLGYSSGFTRGFFNSLANADLSKTIKFWCYVKENERGAFNCASMAQDNEMIKWKYSDVPKTESVKVGSKTVIDDAKAVEWMLDVVKEIKDRLNNPTAENATRVFEIDRAADTKTEVTSEGAEVALEDLPF